MKYREIFEQMTDRLKEIFGKMTSAQRMSIALLAGVLVLSFVLLIFFFLPGSGGAGMEKLFYSPLEPERMDYVVKKLGTTEYTIEDEFVMVPAKDRTRIVAMFLEDPVIYGEHDWFEKLFESSFIDTDAQRDRKFVRAREKQLGALIGHFREVRQAFVGINKGDSTALMRQDLRKPTASVTVMMREGVREMSRETVAAIAATVAGHIKGLNPGDVSIADFSGNYYHVPSIDENQRGGEERLKVLRSVTEYFDDKIRSLFTHIPDFKVATYVDIDWKSVKQHSVTVPDADALPMEMRKMTRKGSSSETSGAVGVIPNVEPGGVGLSGNVAGGRAGPTGSEESESFKRPLTNEISKTVEEIIADPGEYTDITVTASIPYNFLAKPVDGGEIPQDPAEREKIVLESIERIKLQIKGPTGIEDLAKIVVAAKHAVTPLEYPEEPFLAKIWDVVQPNIGTGILVIFAMAALFLVGTFVKKNIPKPQQIPIEEIEEKIEKEVEKEKKDFLTELEKMDESEMKAVQVKERVQDMVNESPENAANLLKTWINKED